MYFFKIGSQKVLMEVGVVCLALDTPAAIWEDTLAAIWEEGRSFVPRPVDREIRRGTSWWSQR